MVAAPKLWTGGVAASWLADLAQAPQSFQSLSCLPWPNTSSPQVWTQVRTWSLCLEESAVEGFWSQPLAVAPGACL